MPELPALCTVSVVSSHRPPSLSGLRSLLSLPWVQGTRPADDRGPLPFSEYVSTMQGPCCLQTVTRTDILRHAAVKNGEGALGVFTLCYMYVAAHPPKLGTVCGSTTHCYRT